MTRIGVPVSTSLVLSAFASVTCIREDADEPNDGLCCGAVAAYAIWIVVSRILIKYNLKKNTKYWRVGQWVTTGSCGLLG